MIRKKSSQTQFFKKLLTCVISTLLSLLIVEFVLFRFTNLRNEDRKTWEQAGKEYTVCYTSDKKGYFPIVKIDPSTGQKLYCLSCDIEKREDGFFQSRGKEVAIIGDSFCFGEGVKDEDSLGYLLGMKFPAFNFRNFGVPGKDIAGISMIFNDVINKEKQIEDIIYFYNLNDVLCSDEIARQQKYINDFENIMWGFVPEHHGFITDILSKSTIYSLLRKAVIIKRESKLTIQNYLDMYSSSNSVQLGLTAAILTSMNNTAKDKGKGFYVVIYPLLYKDGFGRYPFLPIHKYLKDMCRMRGISCIDAYPVFEKYRSLNQFKVHPIDYHPNGLANRLVVDYLAQDDKLNLAKSSANETSSVRP